MKKILPIGIAAATGLTILAGYFFKSELNPVVVALVDWGILLLGVSGLIGIGYLVRMALLRLVHREKGAFFSGIALLAFFLTFVGGFVSLPRDALFRKVILNVQIPLEASLLAILAVTLLAASTRLIRTRGWTPMSISFFGSALATLILNLGFIRAGADSPAGRAIAFLRGLPLIGARGILLGIALGGLLVSLRVLLAIDRPYGGE